MIERVNSVGRRRGRVCETLFLLVRPIAIAAVLTGAVAASARAETAPRGAMLRASSLTLAISTFCGAYYRVDARSADKVSGTAGQSVLEAEPDGRDALIHEYERRLVEVEANPRRWCGRQRALQSRLGTHLFLN